MKALILEIDNSLHQNHHEVGTPWLWTRDRYVQASESGIFDPEERLELLDGIVTFMSPINVNHAYAFRRTENCLRKIFEIEYEVRGQLPIALSEKSQPQPDIVVAKGAPDSYLLDHPKPEDILLVVEVSDATLSTDRGYKAKLYSMAGLREYWIVNLVDRQVEVYRQPTVTGVYKSVSILGESASVATLEVAGSSIKVSDLLPPL